MDASARFHCVLIANRGEIACRIIRSARSLGLRTVAVFSQADAQALHVELADLSVPIGPAPAPDSYLRIDRIIQACRDSGAQAVHPGYGFLSESAAFARACRDAGLVFVGPTPESIDALGNKAAAKLIAQKVGVPCLPGYAGSEQSIDSLLEQAQRIGNPLMIKAAAGGGGRGMRRCDDVADARGLRAQLEAARAEAIVSFGNGDLLLERLLEHSRHVEVQIVADIHGNIVHLGERDCSTQRRHQKILEEAPAPGVDDLLRSSLGKAAIRLAREVGYVGAGTVEFLLAPDGSYYFLEVNTRLQVEHPVTEAVTGIDLVEWQLRIARGETLPLGQDRISLVGHAIEARVCAEDAWAGFVPQSGSIVASRLPDAAGIRVDHGLAQCAQIPPNYDSMIAKVIAHGADREQARARLIGALSELSLLGIVSNRDYLIACLDAERFAAGHLSTNWLATAARDWRPPEPPSQWLAAAASLAVESKARRHGPLAGWSSAGAREIPLTLRVTDRTIAVTLRAHGDRRYEVSGDGWRHSLEFDTAAAEPAAIAIDEMRIRIHTRHDEDGGWLDALGFSGRFDDATHAAKPRDARAGGRLIASTMHGMVVDVAVGVGERVHRGQRLLSIEAMKMEHPIHAGFDGEVTEVGVSAGQQVSPGRLLITIEPTAEGISP